MAPASALRGALLLSLGQAVLAQNPIVVKSTEWLSGNAVSTNDQYVIRDGGWQGTIGKTTVITYADTLQCPDEQSYDTNQNCNFVAPNTIVAASFVADEVIDYQSPTPQTFCSTDGTASGGRLHIANVLPTGDDSGVTWYVDLSQGDQNGCNELDGCPIALGVASVDFNNGNPTCSAMSGFWDASQEPMWGTAAAIGPLLDGYLYLMGQLDGSAGGSQYNDVYVARVPQGSATDYNSYEYWNGNSYVSTRLTNPNYNGYSPASVIPNVEAFGSLFYSDYYNQYVVLAANKTDGQGILAYTAPRPEGPWTDPVTIYSNSSFGGYYEPLYSPQALPVYDSSGKTLTFTASLFGRNSVSGVIKVGFA